MHIIGAIVLFVMLSMLAVPILGVAWFMRRRKRKRLARAEPARSIPVKPPVRDHRWRQGEDLKKYPRQFEVLERRLEQAYEANLIQARHLAAKRSTMEDKGREELVQRYSDDMEVLRERAQSTRRVLATVWKTRAILNLRVHLAIVARQRPELDLPAPLDVEPHQLVDAARDYAHASQRVRTFVVTVDEVRGTAREVLPDSPGAAEVSPDDLDEVAREVETTERTLDELRERMDKLGDNLDYLADRFRTQRVVEGAALEMDLDSQSSALLGEVAGALAQLDSLSALGDKGMADAAVDSLTHEINQLEEVGQSARLEAEANEEVERLLAQFARTQT